MFLILHSTVSDINIIFITLIFNTKSHLLIFRRNTCIILIRYIFYKQNWNVLCFLLFFNPLWAFLLNREFNLLAGIIRTDVFFLVIFLFSAFVLSSSLYVLYFVLFEIHFPPFILYSFCEMNISCFYSSWCLHVGFPEVFLTYVTNYSGQAKCILPCSYLRQELKGPPPHHHHPHPTPPCQPHPASTLWGFIKVTFWTYNPGLCILWHLYFQLA